MKSNIMPIKNSESKFQTYCTFNIINRESLELFFKENPVKEPIFYQ